jgi:hypothetical protein
MSSEIGVLLSKPLATAAVATGISRYMMPGSAFEYDLSFGAAAGLGVFVADMAAKRIQNTHGTVTRSLEERAMEIGLSTGAGLLAKRYIMGQDLYDPIRTSAVIIASDIVAEYLVHSFM